MKIHMEQKQVVRTIIVMMVNAYMCVCSGRRESFSHKIQVNEESFGQLKLDSSGYFANIIHLDTVEGIKVSSFEISIIFIVELYVSNNRTL